jgi:hypothetical protein
MEIPAITYFCRKQAKVLVISLFICAFLAFRGDIHMHAIYQQFIKSNDAKEHKMEWPNWTKLPESPPLDKPGIKVNLVKTAFKASEPVVMYGTYVADEAFYSKCFGEVEPWIMVIAIGRDIPNVWIKPVMDKPNLAPVPMTPRIPSKSSFIQRGFFNIDLREHLHLPNQPARYWLLVTMGDYFIEHIPFEIK